MSRVQLALNVSDLETAVTFYSRLFGVKPAKVRPGYANFEITSPPLKLVLMENKAAPGTLNHLGIEEESTEAVKAASDRLKKSGLEINSPQKVTCCYAQQDKFWVKAPDGADWEIYTVLADSPTFGVALQTESSTTPETVCCS